MKKLFMLIISIYLISISGCAQPTMQSIQYTLISVGNNSGIHGSFFIGCGDIDNNKYYSFFIKLDNGEIVYRTVPVINASIMEDSNNPYLIVSSKYPISYDIKDWFKNTPFSYTYLNFTFHIPSNSIDKSIKFDVNR